MSHFTVLVRIPASEASEPNDVQDAVAKLLAPYQENNMGDCPRQYMEFNDEEDDYLLEFETGSTTMVRLEDGSHAHRWDDRFRVPGTFGTGGDTHRVPEHLKEEEVKHKDRYGTFEKFCADWHGRKERDEEKGRYGYWENPNAKWDWYVIGGRWGGAIPVKSTRSRVVGDSSTFGRTDEQLDETRSDACRLSEIDWDRLATETREKFDKWWGEWQRFLAGEKFDSFYGGPRSTAMNLGYVDCKNDDELTVAERAGKLIPWERELKAGVKRYDVLSNPTHEEARHRYEKIFGGLHPFASCDVDGWHAPGEMGWWACSTDTAESRVKFRDEFTAKLRSGDQQDWVVMVDCHI